ncbi:hypothetical protein FKP32DRAFT_1568428 [Trametes sanguinea]|nr:hypothetical protein FKP32DRAFT_1568428 [Trametes sanguinea]
MEFGPGFFKVRTGIFLIMTFISVVFAAALSVEVFLTDGKADPSQRNFVGVFIFADALTAILMPALLIVQFRPWLDAARLLFLLLTHFGTAILFTVWNPSFRCTADTYAELKQCQSVNTAILVCGWVLPAMLIWYSAFLAVMYYWRKDHPAPEPIEKRLSDLPMMLPSRRPSIRRPSMARSFATPATPTLGADSGSGSHASQLSYPSWLAAPTPASSSPRTSAQRVARGASSVYASSESVYSSQRSSGRLSKPPPPTMYH